MIDPLRVDNRFSEDQEAVIIETRKKISRKGNRLGSLTKSGLLQGNDAASR